MPSLPSLHRHWPRPAHLKCVQQWVDLSQLAPLLQAREAVEAEVQRRMDALAADESAWPQVCCLCSAERLVLSCLWPVRPGCSQSVSCTQLLHLARQVHCTVVAIELRGTVQWAMLLHGWHHEHVSTLCALVCTNDNTPDSSVVTDLLCALQPALEEILRLQQRHNATRSTLSTMQAQLEAAVKAREADGAATAALQVSSACAV